MCMKITANISSTISLLVSRPDESRPRPRRLETETKTETARVRDRDQDRDRLKVVSRPVSRPSSLALMQFSPYGFRIGLNNRSIPPSIKVSSHAVLFTRSLAVDSLVIGSTLLTWENSRGTQPLSQITQQLSDMWEKVDTLGAGFIAQRISVRGMIPPGGIQRVEIGWFYSNVCLISAFFIGIFFTNNAFFVTTLQNNCLSPRVCTMACTQYKEPSRQ